MRRPTVRVWTICSSLPRLQRKTDALERSRRIRAMELAEVFGAAVEQAIFVDHQQAQAVAGVEPFRCGRVMAGTAGVHAHLFEQAGAIVLQIIGHGGADPRVVPGGC